MKEIMNGETDGEKNRMKEIMNGRQTERKAE